MRFERQQKKDSTTEKGTLYEWWESLNGNYKVQKSLTRNHWLAFFRSSKNTFSLVGPPVSSRAKAEELCNEHSLGLPW